MHLTFGPTILLRGSCLVVELMRLNDGRYERETELMEILNWSEVKWSEVTQSCLCDPMDCSLPGCSIHGIFQARVLEWVAISLSNAWKRKVKMKLLSRVRLLATSWTAAYQAAPSMGFSRQEYRSGVPLNYKYPKEFSQEDNSLAECRLIVKPQNQETHKRSLP